MKNLIALWLVVWATLATAALGVNPFPGEEWSTGFLAASDEDKALFYYLFRCRNKSISEPPLMIWLEGGPGYTSAAGIYVHGGPYIVDNMTGKIIWNKDAWNNVADILFVDQPAGTHFSYSNDYNKMCADSECAADDLEVFLENFFGIYPQYRHRNYYVAGISYGGHYVPAIAQRIIDDPDINKTFKGVLIFNGFYDVFRQSNGNVRFLYERGLIDYTTYSRAIASLMFCKVMGLLSIPFVQIVCGQFDAIAYLSFGLNNDPYNVEELDAPDPYEHTMLEHLNIPEVQQALGVNKTFEMYNWTVYDYMFSDALVVTQPYLVPMLNRNLTVFMVHGDVDFVCSHTGGIDVAESIEWDGQEGFVNATFEDWKYKGTTLAQYKKYKNMRYVRVHHVGHSMFYKQREFGLHVIKEFLGMN